jgi:NifB/MoaA-like Fe-S oxidoreductase
MAPVLEGLAAKFADRTGIRAVVVPVPNRFFGETVTVAGLLTGQDVVAHLRECPPSGTVVLPGVMFRGPQGQSLDEMHPDDLARALSRPVFVL